VLTLVDGASEASVQFIPGEAGTWSVLVRGSADIWERLVRTRQAWIGAGRPGPGAYALEVDIEAGVYRVTLDRQGAAPMAWSLEVVDETKTTGDGIAWLRRRRGRQRISINDIADHMEQYRRNHPNGAAIVSDFARFLANAEDDPHRHSHAS